MSYPEPPHYSNGVDLGLSPEPYNAYPRTSHEYAPPPPMAYAGEAPYMYSSHSNSGRASPGMYPDDGEASASSSNMGSPLSAHGQMPATTISDWSSVAAPHGGLGVSPGIVDQSDYFPGDYSLAPPMDHYSPSYEFPAPSKGPGFVGESSQIPRSSSLQSSSIPVSSSSPRPSSGSGRESGHAHAHCGPVSSTSSRESRSTTTVPPKSSCPGLALDTRLARQQPLAATTTSVSSSTVSSGSSSSFSSVAAAPLAMTPPTSAAASPSSLAAWGSPPGSRFVSPFFSQSSGHFVPPLQSCWFFLLFCSRGELRRLA
ncbi:hypothetical protein VTJ49DRAFT_3983 [Mycothermus thermophilus]|uniref:Uncharacterized protein n=1 Tax=Humicola insolens TaxID=85995 RepID=A0ABR3V6E0_HUMIN